MGITPLTLKDKTPPDAGGFCTQSLSTEQILSILLNAENGVQLWDSKGSLVYANCFLEGAIPILSYFTITSFSKFFPWGKND